MIEVALPHYLISGFCRPCVKSWLFLLENIQLNWAIRAVIWTAGLKYVRLTLPSDALCVCVHTGVEGNWHSFMKLLVFSSWQYDESNMFANYWITRHLFNIASSNPVVMEWTLRNCRLLFKTRSQHELCRITRFSRGTCWNLLCFLLANNIESYKISSFFCAQWGTKLLSFRNEMFGSLNATSAVTLMS